MSTIQIQGEWEPSPAKTLASCWPVKEGKTQQANLYRCIVCSNLKTPCTFDENDKPLVLRCIKCGHKSWANG
ncbi:hypothetical protein [Candidatus Nitrosotenuis aquarius]|uniref:hypothetical protein n=1 Tax=Candidatus Nitrosotenuis aquarius TaxID=1846278 RepID=UPI0013C35DED|nr:hypothetical protein [Candidatus Nitrosotenuis aquarius]